MSSLRGLVASLLLVATCSGLPATGPTFGPLDTSLFNNTELLNRRQSSLDNGVQLRILPLGASIVYGYKSTDKNGFRYGLRNQLVYYGNPVNMIGSVQSGEMIDNDVEGWPGYTIDQVAVKAQLSIPSQPNLVLLHVGTNDCVGDVDTANAPARLGNLIDTLFADIPGVTVIASTLLPNLGATAQACVTTLNAGVPGVIAERQAAGKKVIYVDFSSSFFSDADIIPDDGTHPTDAGYLKMAAVWYQGIQVVNEAGWLEAPATVSGVSDVVSASSSTTCEKEPGTAVGPIKTQVGSGRDDGEYVHNPLEMPSISGFADNTNAKGLYWADINGDGIDDYVYIFANTNDGIGIALSEGSGNFGDYAVFSYDMYCNLRGVRWADITGDGRDDLLCIGPDGALTAWENTIGSDARAPVFVSLGIVKTSECTQAEVRIADIDGDGRADYLCVGADGTYIIGWRNGALSNIAPAYWYPMTGVIDGLDTTDISYYRFADLNGDGKDDLIHVNPYGQTKTWINQRGYDVGLTPVWESMGVTHKGFVGLTNVTFGAYWGSGKADYAAIDETSTGITFTTWQNRDSGGTMVKGDGSRYCDMRGTGYDDYIWISYMGEMTIFGNELSPPEWIHYGYIYDVGRIRKEIHLADFDGDGKCDILLVDKATGSTSMLRNDWDGTTFTFTNLGVVSGGAAECTEGYGTAVNDYGVRFADIDGDGRADYLCIRSDGYMSGALNKGLNDLVDQGQLKVSQSFERAHIWMADINGDGRADYLYVNMTNGETLAWTNEGPVPVIGSAFTWTPRGVVAYGNAARGSCINFGNLHGQGRADYIVVDPQVNSAIAFWNVCSGGGEAEASPDLPGIPATVPTPRTSIPIITITTTPTITTPPVATPTCHIDADPDNSIGEYCVCSSYAATLPTLTGTAPCAYTTLPAIQTPTTTAGPSGPYTYTDPLGDVIVCGSSTLTEYAGYAYTQCVNPETTLSTLTQAPTPTATTYNPPIAGSACDGYPPTAADGPEGTYITCPPAAYSWIVYVPNWGAPNSTNFPMTECGKGFLDNLRGRCGVITDWECKEEGDSNADTYYTFATVIECQYWDVQDAFKAANGGAEGLECLRTTCGADTSNPLTGGTKGAATALDIIIGEIFGAFGRD